MSHTFSFLRLIVLTPALMACGFSSAGLLPSTDGRSDTARETSSLVQNWLNPHAPMTEKVFLPSEANNPRLALNNTGMSGLINGLLSGLIEHDAQLNPANLTLQALMALTAPSHPFHAQTTQAYLYPQRTPHVFKALNKQDRIVLFNAFAQEWGQHPGRGSGLIPRSATSALLDRRTRGIKPAQQSQIALIDTTQRAISTHTNTLVSTRPCTADKGPSVGLFTLHCSWKE